MDYSDLFLLLAILIAVMALGNPLTSDKHGPDEKRRSSSQQESRDSPDTDDT